MPAFPLLQRAWNRLRASVAPVPDISAALWLNTLGQYPFLAALTLPEQAKLREKLKPVVDKHGAAIQATLNDLQAELAKLRK